MFEKSFFGFGQARRADGAIALLLQFFRRDAELNLYPPGN